MEDAENRTKWTPYARTYDPLQSGSIDGTDTIPHDRALCRAMEAKYVPPNKKFATPNETKTLFVGRLDFKTTDEGLKEEFSRYGTVTHCHVVRDIVTGLSRGYAFVQFKHHENAELARREAHHVVLEGREILVEWENGRTMPGWVPRRLGGGFGGKKGSGQLRFGGRDRPFRKPIIIKPMKRDESSKLGEEDLKRDMLQESIRRPRTEEEEGEGRKSSRTDNGSESRSSKSSQIPRGGFSKPWNRKDREEWSRSGERDRQSATSWKSQKDWYKGEDRRYTGKSSREGGSSTRDRRYSSKSSRDWRECGERGSTPHGRPEERFRKSPDRESTSEKKDYHGIERRDNSIQSSREGTHQQKLESNEDLLRRLKDWEDSDECDATYEDRRVRKKRRRSLDRDDHGNLDDIGDGKVRKGKEYPDKSLKDRDDSFEWKYCESPISERSDKETNRIKRSSKEDDAYFWKDSTKRSGKSSRDRGDAEFDDDGSEPKIKKKKKHSKKSSWDSESDDSNRKKKGKKKKKKKHKKSRD